MENNSHSIVKLNVGGQNFQTTATTLQGSEFFMRMLQGAVPTLKDENGAYFIDRDPKSFEIILSFLRTFKWNIPPNIDKLALTQEAEFYMLKSSPQLAETTNAPSGLWLGKDTHVFIYDGYCLQNMCSKAKCQISNNVLTVEAKEQSSIIGTFVNNNQNLIGLSYFPEAQHMQLRSPAKPITPIKYKKQKGNAPTLRIDAGPEVVVFYREKERIGECAYKEDPDTGFIVAEVQTRTLQIKVYFFGVAMIVDINGKWKYFRNPY